MDLTDFQDKTWADLRGEIKQLGRRVNRNELYPQAQVGRAVPRFANYAALPTGALGSWGCAVDTGALYFHNGAAWRRVPTVDPALVFTIQNALTDVAYDADATSTAELADVIATIITALGLT